MLFQFSGVVWYTRIYQTMHQTTLFFFSNFHLEENSVPSFKVSQARSSVLLRLLSVNVNLGFTVLKLFTTIKYAAAAGFPVWLANVSVCTHSPARFVGSLANVRDLILFFVYILS